MSTVRSALLAGAASVLLVAGCSDTTEQPPGSSTATTVPGLDNTAGPGAATSGPGGLNVGGEGDLDHVVLRLTEVAALDHPIALSWRPGDDGLYVADWSGTVWRLAAGELSDGPVLDISERTKAGGERGLLGIAFSPDGAFLYVDYTDRNGDTNVDEFAVDAGGTIDKASRRQVLFVEQPYPNHNGGNIRFGPDGYLYIGMGDGGSGGDPQDRAQNPAELLGKLLRIDPRPSGDQPYAVPADNPFVGRSGYRPEIWSLGLRNPWRWSFDRLTGDLWIADVGQDEIEEVDVATAAADAAGRGTNFGWNWFEGNQPYEGDHPTDGLHFPVFQYTHEEGCAITGGFVYRGTAIPALTGVYVFADECNTWIRGITQAGGQLTGERKLDIEQPQIVSFGEGPDGELYVLSFEGHVFRIDAG